MISRALAFSLGALLIAANLSLAAEKGDELALRVVTTAMFGRAAFSPEETRQLDAAKAAALEDADVLAALGKLAAARKPYLEEQGKYPAERNQEVRRAYSTALRQAQTAVRKSFLAHDPSLAPILDRASGQRAGPTTATSRRNEGENATDSDTGNKSAVAPIQDVPGLPRVLLIGDSISIGYTLQVRELLKGKANVHRIPVNGGATEVGLANMKQWLGDGRWDVIHFNFGLHDAKYQTETTLRATREQYLANLQKLIDQMKATGAKLVFATTTPTPAVLSRATRRFDSIPERNDLAVKLMKEKGVAIDDLYAVVLPVQEKIQRPRDVHYTPEGYEILSKAVAASIEAQLPKK